MKPTQPIPIILSFWNLLGPLSVSSMSFSSLWQRQKDISSWFSISSGCFSPLSNSSRTNSQENVKRWFNKDQYFQNKFISLVLYICNLPCMLWKCARINNAWTISEMDKLSALKSWRKMRSSVKECFSLSCFNLPQCAIHLRSKVFAP